MNILYISQYYPPEMGAPSQRVSELAKFWVKQGHSVSIITAMPNHPDGIVHSKYKREYFKEEWVDGVRVLRVFLYVTPNKGVIKRVFSFISFTFTSLFVGLFMNKPDVVIATSPQLFVGISGLFIAKLKRIPFVFEVRDIWPQSAVELKMIRSHLVIRLMEKLEKFLYYKAKLVIVVVKDFFEELGKKGVKKEKIFYIPNGIDAERFNIKENRKILSGMMDTKNKFLIGFIGTIGINHNLITIVKAAAKLSDTDIHFVIIGEGADKEHIKKVVKEKRINNVHIFDKIKSQDVPYVLKELNAGFIHQKNTPLAEMTLPAKMFEIFAAEKPILAGIKGIGKSLIEENNLGFVFTPENIEELILCTKRLRGSRDIELMGKRAKTFVYENFDRDILSKEYVKRLEKLTE